MAPPIALRAKVGEKINRLTVVAVDLRTKRGERAVLCRCDCGTEKIIALYQALSGSTKSCGCAIADNKSAGDRNRTHGMSYSTEYKIWQGMMERCHNNKNPSFHRYGGRGIFVCDGWRASFECFLSDMGYRPDGMSIDRINNDGPYAPENCRWATAREQQANTRRVRLISWNGKTQPLKAWARELGITSVTLRNRLNSGWTPERAFTQPARSQ